MSRRRELENRLKGETLVRRGMRRHEGFKLDLEDLVLERRSLHLLREMASVREIRIVNGHKRGNLTRAIEGEKVGTSITA